MTEISRMQFLRGDVKGKNKPFRPPWAMPEEYFIDYCTRCDKCIEVCFDELIVKGRGGYPQMDFNKGGCDFCEDCLNICESNALHKIPVSNDTATESIDYLPPWRIRASIDLNNCLSMNATICRSCGEACEVEAINFNLQLGGIAEPVLTQDQCNGCGACYAVCPVRIIELTAIVIEK